MILYYLKVSDTVTYVSWSSDFDLLNKLHFGQGLRPEYLYCGHISSSNNVSVHGNVAELRKNRQ